MRAKWKRGGQFLCFGALDPEEEEEEEAVKKRERSAGSAGRAEVLVSEARRHRLRLDSRVLAKIFKSAVFVSSPNRGGRSVGRKASDYKPASELSGKSSDGDDRMANAILSLSSSSSSASSSCLSSASPSSLRQPVPKPKPELWRKRSSPRSESNTPPPPPPAVARNYVSATGLFLLLLSLSVMVFCGRLYAILWTSSWLCLVSCWNSEAGLAVGPPEIRRNGLTEDEKKRVVLEGLLERNRRV